MSAHIDMASAAAVQRSRTLAPTWRDSSGSLVRGGVLQLQKTGVPMCICLGGPLSRLLSPPPDDERLSSSTGCLASPKAGRHAARSSEGGTGKRTRKALRDRLAASSTLDDALRAECLERLDSIAARVPPARRPEWTEDGAALRLGRSRGLNKDRGSRGESSCSSDRSGGSSDKTRGSGNGSQLGGPMAFSLPGRSTNTSAHILSAAREVGAIRTADQQTMSPAGRGRQRFSEPGFAGHTLSEHMQAELKPVATTAWRCNSRLPSRGGKRETKASKDPQIQVSRSMPLLTAPAAPRAAVSEVHRAVAAARDALEASPHLPEDRERFLASGAGGHSGVPERGAGSLLRTSLRYALQA